MWVRFTYSPVTAGRSVRITIVYTGWRCQVLLTNTAGWRSHILLPQTQNGGVIYYRPTQGGGAKSYCSTQNGGVRYYCPTQMVEVPNLTAPHTVWRYQVLLPHTQGGGVRYFCPTHRVKVPSLTAPHTGWRCQVLLPHTQGGGAHSYSPNILLKLIYPSLWSNRKMKTLPTLCIMGKLNCTVNRSDTLY